MHSAAITGISAVMGESLPQTTSLPVHTAEDLDYREIIGKRGLQYLTPATKMALSASALAWEDACLGELSPHLGGVVLATNLSSLEHTTTFDWTSLDQGVNYVSPMQGPNLLLNASASRLGIFHKLTGFNTTISSGRIASLDALEYAVYAIERGEVEVCIIAGAEELSTEYLRWFQSAGLIDSIENHPLTEGAGVLIIESLEHARQRGAKIYGKIKGFSNYFDPDILSSADHSQQGREGYDIMLDDIVSQAGQPVSSIREVCIADDRLCANTEDEIAWMTDAFVKEVSIVKHSEEFGECYGLSGIIQVMLAMTSGNASDSLIFNKDWFGNYRSVLIEKGE